MPALGRDQGAVEFVKAFVLVRTLLLIRSDDQESTIRRTPGAFWTGADDGLSITFDRAHCWIRIQAARNDGFGVLI